jgi:hypothetical protein
VLTFSFLKILEPTQAAKLQWTAIFSRDMRERWCRPLEQGCYPDIRLSGYRGYRIAFTAHGSVSG